MTIIDAKRHGARQCWACWQWTRPAELEESVCRQCRAEEATTVSEAVQPSSDRNAHTPLERSLERDVAS